MPEEHSQGVPLPGRTYVARHAQTVFNATGRIQAELLHTPLTRGGIAQAEAMGEAFRHLLGPRPEVELWASPTGRTLQTLAIICEHLELDWHAAHTDPRLGEIGMGGWDGQRYELLEAEHGPIYDRELRLFVQRPPGGEAYGDVAARITDWVREQTADLTRIVVTHGVSGAVLRAVVTGEGRPHPSCRTPVADPLPQGSIVLLEGGRESVAYLHEED